VKTAKVAATSSATGYMQIRQKIEVEDWMDNRVYTLSAWVKSNTPYPRLRIESAGPTLGNIDSEQTHSGSGNWEYLTMTFTSGNSIVSFNAGVIDWAGNATRAITSGDYFEVANVQLELGKVATPFEHRSYGEELALCQRYYYRIGSGSTDDILGMGGNIGATTAYFTGTYPVEMRTTPTITVNNFGYFRCHTSAGSGLVPTAFAATSENSNQRWYVNFTLPSAQTAGAANLCMCSNNAGGFGIVSMNAEL